MPIETSYSTVSVSQTQADARAASASADAAHAPSSADAGNFTLAVGPSAADTSYTSDSETLG